ncbi:hypothetical protein WJX82_010845 [Trebouxia sp. C0006]
MLDLRQKYVQLSRQIVPALEMQAIHLAKANTPTDPQYLVHKAMAGSTFGTVLHLRDVCWLDISASFQRDGCQMDEEPPEASDEDQESAASDEGEEEEEFEDEE